MSTGKEAKECYISTLADLIFNSRPLISVLTMLAEENIAHAPDIVEAIESHLVKGQVDVKLPALYLIDCIIKNIGGIYKTLLSQNIVSIFCHVFQVANEKTRGEMFKLRQTWNDELPKQKLCELDVKVNQFDPAWPIVAPPITNNIHLNPKFLHNSAIPKKSPPITVPSQNRMTSIIAANQELDSSTIDMHKKILLKQKQLLELERKKLELELLQQQVKLQEQMKTSYGNTQQPTTEETSKIPKSQNILLKPEVAKQLSTTGPKVKNVHNSGASRLHSGQAVTTATSTTPRIAPVNSALVAAAASRPIRDPRLLRHQNNSSTASSTTTTSNLTTTVNTNVLLESKISNTTETSSSNNKNFSSKVSVRDNRTEPRQPANSNNNNDSNILSQNNKQTKSITQSPTKRLTGSKQSSSLESSPSPTKTKSSRISSKSSISSNSSEGGSSKGSTSSLDSPSKSKNKTVESKLSTRSAMAFPSKHKKKEASIANSSASSIPIREKKKEKSSSSKIFANISKIEKEIKSSPIKRDNSPPTSFKELKGSKSRNYIRRNREPSSPEPISMDVDLRSTSGPPEKQPRFQPEIPEEKGASNDLTTPGMDIDLRQLPAIISKKRPSTEAPENSNPKKTKMEVFDELFGNEDTDLRQLPTVRSSPKVQDRPPTPPPPIISSLNKTENDDITKVEINRRNSPKSNENLALLREKLANATIRNKKNNTKFTLQKNKPKPIVEDVDLRTNSEDSYNNKIIISSADEQCINTGNMTKQQQTALMNKILAQIENQKLKEAKRTEETIGNISLQPISDEELDADFSASSDEDLQTHRPNMYSDKDERIPPPAPHINSNEPFGNFLRNNNIDRRGMWRNRPRRGMALGRGMHNNNPRMLRPQIPPPDAWIRPNPPWRPMGLSMFTKTTHAFNPDIIIDVDNNSVDTYDQNSNPGMSMPSQDTPEIMIVDCANEDNIKSIVIDNESRDIRYYGDTAVVFMSCGDPREISFQNGSRKVYVGEKDVFILSFNEPYKEINVNGKVHRIKLGGPSRELHVDDKYYECFIGGPGIRIELDGEFVLVKIEGPPPQVKIGQVKTTDLVAGKINLIIDAKTVIPVFLDGKLQKFDINGETHSLKFVNSLKVALIDDVPFEVEFGGLPKSFMLHDKKYYIRFSVLPRGIKPGLANINDMDTILYPMDQTEPALPVFTKTIRPKILSGPPSPDRNSNSPLNIQNMLQQQSMSTLDTLSSIMASTLKTNQPPNNLNISSYQVENDAPKDSTLQNPPEVPTNVSVTSIANVLPPSLNINELFQKLVATGIVTTVQENQSSISTHQPPTTTPAINRPVAPVIIKKDTVPIMKPVTFNKPETLKMRQPALTSTLYLGMQCSSCGMRFPPEHSIQYSQHLDWHFRQNRKGKKNIRKASSRRWYYSLSDWKNYEEIEDLEEREKSYFENQQQAQAEGASDEAEEEIEIPSVPADPTVQDAKCEVCEDRFDQFYNEEKEEWHLRMAVKVDDKNYHPLCYEDYQTSLIETTYEDPSKDEEKIDIPGFEISSDSTDRIGQDSEMPQIVIDDDESEQLTDNGNKIEDEEMKSQDAFPEVEEEDDGEDDDVILNEIVPVRIDLVDDDKYEEMSTEELPKVMVKEEPIDDGFVEVVDGVIKTKSIVEVKIKTEPLDADDELQITGEERLDDLKRNKLDLPHNTEVVTLIDGNIEFDSSVPPTSGISGKIKINITKSLPVIAPKESCNKELSSEIERSAESIDPSQPLPPGEEPIQLNLKPALQGVKLKKLPPVKRGTELTGLCSIM